MFKKAKIKIKFIKIFCIMNLKEEITQYLSE